MGHKDDLFLLRKSTSDNYATFRMDWRGTSHLQVMYTRIFCQGVSSNTYDATNVWIYQGKIIKLYKYSIKGNQLEYVTSDISNL
jgi:hypothetical protein